MTVNAILHRLTYSHGLVVRNVKRNVVGSREQLSLQTTLEGGRHDDASDHPRKTVQGILPSDGKRAPVTIPAEASNLISREFLEREFAVYDMVYVPNDSFVHLMVFVGQACELLNYILS